jgi:Family of unknown function (DUF6345)
MTSRRGLLLFLFLCAGLVLAFSGSASAGEHDGVNTVGIWAVGDYPPPLATAVPMGQGFGDGFAQTSFTVRDFYSNGSPYASAAKERHLRDPQFSINGHPGNDQYSFDENDIGMFVDHGGWPGGQLFFSISPAIDASTLLTDYVRWGNYELKWVYIFACYWMRDGNDGTLWEKEKKNMAGAHVICGFATQGWLFSDGYAQGGEFVTYLKMGYSFEVAWETANDIRQPAGTVLKTRWATSPNCRNDALPGFGSYQSGTPQPYPTGAVSEFIFPV